MDAIAEGLTLSDVIFLVSPQSGKKILLTKSLFQKVRVCGGQKASQGYPTVHTHAQEKEEREKKLKKQAEEDAAAYESCESYGRASAEAPAPPHSDCGAQSSRPCRVTRNPRPSSAAA